MKKTLKCLYFWIVSKFKDNMIINTGNQEWLEENRSNLFIAISELLDEFDSAKKYQSCEIVEGGKCLNFRVGDRKFVVETALRPSKKTMQFITYEIVSNRESYPNKKMELVLALSMDLFSNGKIKFMDAITEENEKNAATYFVRILTNVCM